MKAFTSNKEGIMGVATCGWKDLLVEAMVLTALSAIGQSKVTASRERTERALGRVTLGQKCRWEVPVVAKMKLRRIYLGTVTHF